MTFAAESKTNYLILYREVKSDDELESDIINDKSDVENVSQLLEDVRDGVEDYHKLDDLDVRNYFRDWISTVLANSDSLGKGIDNEIKRILEYLAEDFSGSMLSRAREEGKYVVFIVSEDSLIAAHSFTGKKALTTDMTVIEELLSESNIDKFAEFEYNKDGNIIVQHYDRNDTQSFTDWLGIPEDEIAFNIKGDVRIYTVIDEIDVVFEFDEEDITGKLLGSDNYDLADGLLITPNEQPRRVDRIRWGHTTYSEVDEFKQDLFKVSHNLARAFDMYSEEISDSLDSFFDVEDQQNQIVKDKGDKIETIPKPNVDFELVFINQYVKMNVPWRKELAQNLFSEHSPIPICHAGGEFSEHPFELGNFRIYNELGLSEIQSHYIRDLLKTAHDMGSANLRPLFTHIVFEILSRSTSKPLRYLFEEFSIEFKAQFLDEISSDSRVIQTEGEDIDLEWKAPPWFERESSAEDLAQEIHREFQNSRLLLLGISEDSKEIDVIREGIKSEKLNKIEDSLVDDFGVTEAHIWSVPIEDGHIVVALNIDLPNDPMETDFSTLDSPR